MNHYEVVFEIDTEDEDEIREALKLIQNSHKIYEVKVRKGLTKREYDVEYNKQVLALKGKKLSFSEQMKLSKKSTDEKFYIVETH